MQLLKMMHKRYSVWQKVERGTTFIHRQWSALHQAVLQQNLAMLHLLLEHQALIDIENEDGETPLYVAVLIQRYDAVNFLLDNGADPDHEADDGWSCLMAAAVCMKDYVMTKTLLEAGADVCSGSFNVLDMTAALASGQPAPRKRESETDEEVRAKCKVLYSLMKLYIHWPRKKDVKELF